MRLIALLLVLSAAPLALTGCAGVNASYQDTNAKHVPYYWSTWPGADKEWAQHCEWAKQHCPCSAMSCAMDKPAPTNTAQ